MAYTKNEKLWQRAMEKKVLIAAHRGSCGGSLVQNNHLTFKAALMQGADIIETDVALSKDGVPFCLHTGMEALLLHKSAYLSDIPAWALDQLPVYNWLAEESGTHIERLEENLDRFPDAFFNIDRTWFFWDQILDLINSRAHDNIILKCHPDPVLLKKLEDSKCDVMFMPIVNTKDELMMCLDYDINLAAVEIIFKSLDSELIAEDMFAWYEKNHLLSFVNSETINARPDDIMCGPYGDNAAIESGEDASWGKLADMGFRIIQTDWAGLLRDYLERTERRLVC